MSTAQRGLSLFALTMIAIGATIGSGIFQTPSDIAAEVPQPKWIMLLWILGGVVSLLGALVFAELGARFPRSGGVYTYLNEAYGSLPGFLYGWCLLTVISSGTIAALSVVFADNFNYFIGLPDDLKPILAAGSIVVLTLFNTLGIRSSEWFANISTVLKIVGIYALLIVALYLGDKAIFGYEVSESGTTASIPGGNFAIAFVGVLWSFTGWHYASFVSGDAINPKRNIPLAMVFGTLVVTLTYVLCNAGYLKVLSAEEMSNTSTLAADVMNKVIPGSGNYIAGLIAISVFGCAGLYVLSTPRIFNQMAIEGLFFKIFAKKHPRFGVPLNAIILQSAWAIVLVFFWGKFEALYTYVTFTEWLFLLAACIGIFIIRSRFKRTGRSSRLAAESTETSKTQDQSGFRTPLYPIVPALFVLIIGWFISQNILSKDSSVYAGLLVLPVGVIFYYLYRRYSK